MVNAKSLAVSACLVTVLTVAVLGAEKFNSGNYSLSLKFSANFDGTLPFEGEMYTKSSTSCSNINRLGRKLKGDQAGIPCISKEATKYILFTFSDGSKLLQDGDFIKRFDSEGKLTTALDMPGFQIPELTSIEQVTSTKSGLLPRETENGLEITFADGKFQLLVTAIEQPGKPSAQMQRVVTHSKRALKFVDDEGGSGGGGKKFCNWPRFSHNRCVIGSPHLITPVFSGCCTDSHKCTWFSLRLIFEIFFSCLMPIRSIGWKAVTKVNKWIKKLGGSVGAIIQGGAIANNGLDILMWPFECLENLRECEDGADMFCKRGGPQNGGGAYNAGFSGGYGGH